MNISEAGHRRVPESTAVDYAKPTDANIVRDLIARAGTTQRGAAKELEINERTMRGYCAGDKVPRVVMLALERLVDMRSMIRDDSR